MVLKNEKTVPLWPLKLHYFLAGSGGAPILPFLPIIGKQMGISGRGLGFILALIQTLGLIIKFVFTHLTFNITKQSHICLILGPFSEGLWTNTHLIKRLSFKS